MNYNISNLLGHGQAYLKDKRNQGRLYLQGEQVHFHAAVAKALNLVDNDHHLAFDISIDLLQSWMNGIVTYRVDYVVEAT